MIMKERINDKYCPDIAIPPGETLLEIIEEIGMTQVELAERMGHSEKTINEIIKGESAITSDTAIQLERVLNIPAHFWNNFEMNYRADLVRNFNSISVKVLFLQH